MQLFLYILECICNIYLFLVVLGLHCYFWASCSCGEWRLRFVAAHGRLRVATSLVAEHRFCVRAAAVAARRLSHCGAQA